MSYVTVTNRVDGPTATDYERTEMEWAETKLTQHQFPHDTEINVKYNTIWSLWIQQKTITDLF